MKKIAAILTLIALLAGLCSCGLIRKATPPAELETTGDTSEASDAKKGGSDETKPADDSANDNAIRYTEDQAYDTLIHSFPDYDTDFVVIERTGALVAENDGTEYYIFNVSLPKKVETETEKEGGEESETETESETRPVEMEPAVPYYVSVNGVVHTAVGDNNVDTKKGEEIFRKTYGDKDEATGYEYKLEYEKLVKNGEKLCYRYLVYTVNTSGDEAKNELAFKFLLTIDGKYHAKDEK